MEIGAAVWVRDADLSWVPSTVISKDEEGGSYKIITIDAKFVKKEFSYRFDISDQTNGELDGIKLRNDESEATVEDLINLPHLHEPAILHCLQNRYSSGNIYSYTGPILIALNPFKALPLYSPLILESYYNCGLLKSQGIDVGRPLPPHVYAVADAAYRDMMRVISQNTLAKLPAAVNQTILISGESGAGKTESTKIVLRYLTTVGNSSGSSGLITGSVMDKVLQSNPILESFGNARTLRNDNSSRFGKFIELQFSKRGHLIGGVIRTYLLEKVRLAAQQNGERNFHVMYQLIAGCTTEEKVAWQLTSAEDYWYCNQGKVYSLVSVDDAEELSALRIALSTLNFGDVDQQSLFAAVAGLLHLSEVKFVADGDGCKVASTAHHFQTFSRLCGLSVDELERVLTVRIITAAKDDTCEIGLNVGQAVDARDALSKALYSRLFEWIVLRVNKSIRVEETSRVRAEIGVLDIFGFESFQINSFEQLCINYTNETLQQQFNQFVFKLEQAEYQREEIFWSFIEFPDNQDCLDLIEHKQNGILAVLDDVCKLPQASDEKFAHRLYKLLEKNPRFTASVAQKRDLIFNVTHYAGPVEYLASSFVEKNKNELPKEAMSLLSRSTLPLLTEIFSEHWSPYELDDKAPVSAAQVNKHGNGSTSGAAGGKVPSVSNQFKSQLAQLMEKVSSTMPHYIRCLKPNDENKPDEFNRRRTTEQLRYGGVLEAVRVARSGFPVRLSHSDFFTRYRCLANRFNNATAISPLSRGTLTLSITRGQVKADVSDRGSVECSCSLLLSALWDDEIEPASFQKKTTVEIVGPFRTTISRDNIQCGLTKVFIRKAAHDMLEGRRSRKLRAAAERLQSWYRGYLVRRLYLMILDAICLIQRVYRGVTARRRARSLKWNRAAVRVQTVWRTSFATKRYSRLCMAVVTLQSSCRRKAAKEKALEIAMKRNSIRLQSIMRGAVAKIRWRRCRRGIVALQSVARHQMAKLAVAKRRADAEDLGRMRLSSEAIKLEIELLRNNARDEARRALAEAEERSTAAAMEELLHIRDELKAAKLALEQERCSNKTLEGKLAISELDFLKATAQIIDLRGLIATDESDDDDEDEWQSSVSPRDKFQSGPKASTSRNIRRGPKVDRPHFLSRDGFSPGACNESADPRRRSYTSLVADCGVFCAPKEVANQNNLFKKTFRVAAAGQSLDDKPTTNDTVVAFEKNLSFLRARLRHGLSVHLWEEGPASHVQSFECHMSLDRTYEVLLFTGAANIRRGAFSLFSHKIEIQPIRIADIVDCLSSAASVPEQPHGILSVFSSLSQDQRLSSMQQLPDALTIIVRSQSPWPASNNPELPRVVSLKLRHREDRNFLLSALRTLIGASRTPDKAVDASTANRTMRPRPVSRTASFKQKEEFDRAKTRPVSDVESDSETIADLKKQLTQERMNYDRLMLQVFAHTNDLNEKDSAISKLKQRQVYLEKTIAANEKLHEQDAIVRLQLGKRMEQVLLDKEEAYEELDLFKEKLESIQLSMSIIDLSKVSVDTISSSSSPRS